MAGHEQAGSRERERRLRSPSSPQRAVNLTQKSFHLLLLRGLREVKDEPTCRLDRNIRRHRHAQRGVQPQHLREILPLHRRQRLLGGKLQIVHQTSVMQPEEVAPCTQRVFSIPEGRDDSLDSFPVLSIFTDKFVPVLEARSLETRCTELAILEVEDDDSFIWVFLRSLRLCRVDADAAEPEKQTLKVRAHTIQQLHLCQHSLLLVRLPYLHRGVGIDRNHILAARRETCMHKLRADRCTHVASSNRGTARVPEEHVPCLGPDKDLVVLHGGLGACNLVRIFARQLQLLCCDFVLGQTLVPYLEEPHLRSARAHAETVRCWDPSKRIDRLKDSNAGKLMLASIRLGQVPDKQSGEVCPDRQLTSASSEVHASHPRHIRRLERPLHSQSPEDLDFPIQRAQSQETQDMVIRQCAGSRRDAMAQDLSVLAVGLLKLGIRERLQDMFIFLLGFLGRF
mmetsp:Transcript_1474/g.3194  ORF Transcript_1474/g.3194 Transcript_1474/m.3194 type:complete len:454 (+) Transcript_1474:2499-3860(+)